MTRNKIVKVMIIALTTIFVFNVVIIVLGLLTTASQYTLRLSQMERPRAIASVKAQLASQYPFMGDTVVTSEANLEAIVNRYLDNRMKTVEISKFDYIILDLYNTLRGNDTINTVAKVTTGSLLVLLAYTEISKGRVKRSLVADDVS